MALTASCDDAQLGTIAPGTATLAYGSLRRAAAADAEDRHGDDRGRRGPLGGARRLGGDEGSCLGEIETDTVTSEIESSAAGRLRHIAVEGDTYQVGDLAGELLEDG